MLLMPNGRFLGVATTLAAVSTAGTVALSAEAADFSHAQRIYVAPSSIDRRIDFASVREHQAVNLSGPRVPRTTTVGAGSKAGGKSSSLLPPLPGKTPGKTTYAGISLKQAMSTPQGKAYINSLKNRAKQFLADGRFEEAKQQLAVALKLTPEQKAMLREVSTTGVDRARKLLGSQDLDGAVRAARQALVLDATNPDAQKTLSDVLQAAGVNPADATARLRAAGLLAEQGRNDEAAIEYRVAAKLKPTPDSYIGLGNIAMRSGQKDIARANYLKAIEIEPNSATAHRQMGFLRYSERDIVGANADLSRAIILDPKDGTSGRALVELWQQQVQKVPGANSHLGLARAYQLSGDLNSAQAQYREVVRLEPNNPHLPAARHSFKLALSRQQAARAAQAAATLNAQGAYGAAYQKISEAVNLSPGDGTYHLLQGELLERLGNPSAAHQSYMNVLKHDPTNSAAAARIKAISTPPPMQAQVPSAQPLPGSAAMAAPTAMVPPAGMPFPSHDPVQNLSNFATQLRDHMITHQHALNTHEDAIMAGVSAISGGPKKATGENLVTATVGTATSGELTPGGVQSTLAQARSALLAAGASPAQAPAIAPSVAPAAATPPPAAPAPAPAYGQAPASTLPEYASQAHPPITGMAPGTYQPVGNQAVPYGTPIPQYATPAPQPQAPPFGSPDYGKPQIVNLPPQAPPFGSPAYGQPQPVNVPPQFVYGPGQYTQPVAGQFNETPPPPSPEPALRGPHPAPQAVPGSVAAVQPGQVRLELESASPKIDGVHLDVVLRNDSDAPLELPPKLKAVLRYASRDAASVKVSFAQQAVPAHGVVHGTITVPFNKVDPTADLILPDVMPPGSSVRDVHLTTAISLR